MISLQRARSIIWNTARVLPSEKIALLDCLGRVIAEDIIAPFDYPPFDRSAMDGYAVKVKDTYSATRKNPVFLKIAGEIQSGLHHRFRLSSGNCFSVMTGGNLPEGTQAVIKIEDIEVTKIGKSSYIKIFKPVKKGENISFKGEDIRKGKIVVKNGSFIDAAVLMMLAYLGKSEIKVRKQPQVSIVATGDELIEPGARLTKSKIYNSNSYGLYALVKKNGGVPDILGIGRDNEESLTALLRKSLDYNIAIISGGVSEGRFDLVVNVLRNLGVKDIFWKVAVKPGKPVFFGKKGDTLIFGLPGYPVSTYLSFHMLVKVALNKMLGYKQPAASVLYGTLSKDIKNDSDRTSLLRVKVVARGDENLVIPYHKQKSGMLSSVVETNGILIVEKGTSIKKGQKVRVEIINRELPQV